LVVAVLFCIRYLVVKYFDLFPVEYLNVTLAEVRYLRVVKLPVIIVKEPETDAETVTGLHLHVLMVSL
jgi:gamma-glutamylcysteine synthetase